jgi:Flp pilus assembly protein TadD
LWLDTVRKAPGSARAQLGYALELVAKRQFAEAEPYARTAVSLEPENPLAQRTLGLSLAGQGKTMEGLTRLQRALELFPDDLVARQAIVQMRTSLASAYAGTGRVDEAITEMDAALALAPPEMQAELQRRRAEYVARRR